MNHVLCIAVLAHPLIEIIDKSLAVPRRPHLVAFAVDKVDRRIVVLATVHLELRCASAGVGNLCYLLAKNSIDESALSTSGATQQHYVG